MTKTKRKKAPKLKKDQKLVPVRTYKDRLFRMIFREKQELLSLYNALNGTHYNNPDDLEVITLEDVIYMGVKNDSAFLFGNMMNLWEHQSTYNPNMPLRGLFYFSRLYQRYIKEHGLNIYGGRLLRLPMPQYIVFYNGVEDAPDKMELKLSSSFLRNPEANPADASLEVKAVMLNINYGKNRALMRQCRKLEEYAIFIARVRKNLAAGKALAEAVKSAIDSCVKEGILADILSVHEEEVVELFLTNYDMEEHMKLVGKEQYAYGMAQGKAESICLLLEEICILPSAIKEKIYSEEDVDILNNWLKAARWSQSIDEFLQKTGLSTESTLI